MKSIEEVKALIVIAQAKYDAAYLENENCNCEQCLSKASSNRYECPIYQKMMMAYRELQRQDDDLEIHAICPTKFYAKEDF